MALITGSNFVDVLLALLLVLYFIYWFLTNNDDYWDKRGVPNVRKGLLVGALTGKQSQTEAIKELYKSFPGQRYVGFFQLRRPVLMIKDLELIHKILVKDFTYFHDRSVPQFKDDPLSQNLVNLKGEVWRALRYKLTPTFTTGKLKGMFEQISKCGDNMIEKIENLSKENTDIESKSFLFEFTSDVIASCAFGVQFSPKSPEYTMFTSAIKKIFTLTPSSFFKFSIVFLSPKLAGILGLKQTPEDISDYFLKLVKDTLKYRKENNIKRNDYLQLLLTLKEQEESGKDMNILSSDHADHVEDDLIINQMKYTEHSDHTLTPNIKLFTEESICANSFIFLIAGSETTSTTISMALYELAQHQDIQQRLQQEVDSVLASHGGWSYQAIKEMIYLDQVIQESQRICPALPMLTRECVQPYKVQGSDLVIEKGVQIAIPVPALHMDPQNYPDPEQFIPDRFEGNHFKPNPAFLPFGDGPRICIAMRFAVMEVKTCVARIMSQYTVKLSPKTQVPLKFDVRSFLPSVKDGIWLKFEKRQKSSM